MCVCVTLCTTVVHNTAQSSSDYLPSYPPDKHQSLGAIDWRGGDVELRTWQYQGKPARQISSSKVRTHTDTRRNDYSAWTTKVFSNERNCIECVPVNLPLQTIFVNKAYSLAAVSAGTLQ